MKPQGCIPQKYLTLDFKNPCVYRAWHQLIGRYWMYQLTPAEFACVMFIFDRTIGWNKMWETLPYRQFVEGYEGDGGFYGKCEGTDLPLITVRRVLKSLIEKGAVITRQGPQRGHRGGGTASSQYSLNLEWDPESVPPKKKRVGKTKRDPEVVAAVRKLPWQDQSATQTTREEPKNKPSPCQESSPP